MVRMRFGKHFCSGGKAWGMALMIAGLILMMIIVPGWAWAGILCTVMILAGMVIWRFC